MISSSPSMAETGGQRAQPRPDSHQAQTSIQTTHIRGAATTVQRIDRPGQKESRREEDLEEAPRSWARYLEDPDRTTRDQAPIRDRVRQDVPRLQHGMQLSVRDSMTQSIGLHKVHSNKQTNDDTLTAGMPCENRVDVATADYHSQAAASGSHGRSESLGIGDRPDLQGRTLGDFVLGEVLGEGGAGVVYRAEQRMLARPAVVKVIQRAIAGRRDISERFVREARLASRFDHPYAAHVYAFGIEPDGLMWIAMEFVDGRPLSQLIQQSGPLALDRFVPLFERVCEVVQSAHDQGIVHRDIKPSNVMVIERAGRLMPKLLDFGIAKLVLGAEPSTVPTEPRPALGSTRSPSASTTAGSWGLTSEGQVLGSPHYMAPEQWLDATSAGPKADQYALALLAFEALTGSHAYEGRTIEALAHQHLHEPLPSLSPHLPAALRGVLARAGDKLPEHRFENLTELADAVRIARGLGRETGLEEPLEALPEAIAPYP